MSNQFSLGRHIALAVLSLAALAVATPPTSASKIPVVGREKNALLIVPGRRVGDIFLHSIDFDRRLGEPDAADGQMGQHFYGWCSRGPGAGGMRYWLYIYTCSDPENGGSIQDIRVESPTFMTKESISTATPFGIIRRHFPRLRCVTRHQLGGNHQLGGKREMPLEAYDDVHGFCSRNGKNSTLSVPDPS